MNRKLNLDSVSIKPIKTQNMKNLLYSLPAFLQIVVYEFDQGKRETWERQGKRET